MLLSKKHWVVVALSLILFAGGCAENPGTWSKERVAEKVKESLQLTEVSLEESPGGDHRQRDVAHIEVIAS